MSPEPSIAVVVVTFNSADVVGGLLACLPEAMTGLRWDLVVVDNDSGDETLAVVEEGAPGARVVRMGRNAGYAAGVNAGIETAGRRDAFLVLNPDVRLEPGSVVILHAALATPGVGIAVPRLSDATGRRIDSQRREPTIGRAAASALLGARRAGRLRDWGEVVTDDASYERSRPTDWAEGSTQLISSACVAEVGAWDESFFLYSEETDYHLRARDTGHGAFYEPAARGQHLEGGSGTSPILWPLLVANRVRLHRKRHGPSSAAAYWLVLVVQEATRAVLGRATSRVALRVLFSPRLMRAPRGPAWLAALPGSAQALDDTDD